MYKVDNSGISTNCLMSTLQFSEHEGYF